MTILLVSADLMLASSAQGAADRHGAALLVASSSDAALGMCETEGPDAVVVDLRLPGLDIAKMVHGIRERAARPTRLVACGPHVHEQSLAAAAAAGCDDVITRGEFDRRVDALLAQLKASTP